MATVLLLSGPPKAGKSRLRGDLYELLRQGRHPWRKWFVEVLSPDGEGIWTNEAWGLGRGPQAEETARAFKRAVKEAGHFFSPAFVERKRAQLAGLARWAELVIGDLGGIPSPENRQIVDPVLQGHRVVPVVLLREGEDGGWAAYWAALGLAPVVAQYGGDLAARLLAAAQSEGQGL